MTEDRDKHLAPESAEAAKSSSPAERALAEAAERRKKNAAEKQARAKEIGGREGPDPARYGDWEKGGIASDF